MYRVLLVDDESMARVGLRSTFDWKGNGFQLVGEASNGKRAMKWIENQEVDILITDIAMPVMDGLELTRKTREICPWVKVLLLSCHNDFDYVREGIRLGASDYLLKPTLETEDLKKVLERMKDQVTKEKERLELYSDFNKLKKRQGRTEQEIGLMKLLADESVAVQDIALDWAHKGYRIVICVLESTQDHRSKKDFSYMESLLEVKESFYNVVERGIAFIDGADQLILLVPDVTGDLHLFSEYLVTNGYCFTMGVSETHKEMARIHQAYEEGINAVQYRFYYGSGGIHIFTDFRNPADTEIGCYKTKNKLKDLIGAGLKDKAGECLAHLFDYWAANLCAPAEVIQDAQEIVSMFYMHKDDNVKAVEQIEALRLLEFVEDVKQLLWRSFESLWNHTDDPDDENTLHQRMVKQALDYINEHFTEAISLQDVARHVNISKNYFSELFKRETGQNFIDYLIQLRLRRAKHLLQTTTYKVYEVAELSGFNDVKYFSKLFKKMVSVSPAEYQGMRKEAEK
jgi:two-component system response regulator YesN